MATITLHPPVKSRRRHEATPSNPTPIPTTKSTTTSSSCSTSPAHQRPSSPRLTTYYHYPPPTSTNFPTSPYHRPPSPKYPSRPSSPKYPSRPSSPKYPSRPSSPKYPSRPSSPKYPSRPSSPKYPSRSNSPKYPSRSTSPTFNFSTSPKFSSSPPKFLLSPSHRNPTILAPNSHNGSPEHVPRLLNPAPTRHPRDHPATTTTSSSSSSGSRSLQCTLCVKSYRDARILPCFHTFCADCLERSCLQRRAKGSKVDSVYCPVCMDSSELTSKGIQGLPRNMYVEHLQEIQMSTTTTSSSRQPTCDLCVGCEVAVRRCGKCACNLCEFCMRAHQKQRKTSLHQLVELPPSRGGRAKGGGAGAVGGAGGSRDTRKTSMGEMRKAYCELEEHGHEELQFHCKDCNLSLCKQCVLAGHTSHAIIPLTEEEADARYSQSLQTLLERATPLEASLRESLSQLEFVACGVQRRSEAVSEEVIEFVSGHMRALQEHKRWLLLQLDAVRKQKESTLRLQAAHLTEVLQELESSRQLASRALQDGTPQLAFASSSSSSASLGGHSASSVAAKLEELVSAAALETSPAEDDYIHFRAHMPAGERDGFKMFGTLDSQGPSAAHTSVEGDGLHTAREGKVAQFRVRVHDRHKQRREVGGDRLEVVVSGPNGGREAKASIGDNGDGTYMVSYTPTLAGDHRVSVLVEDKHIRGSPFAVSVRGKGGGRRHRGIFHCCTFCSSEGKKHVRCGCGSTMPGGYSGCGHGYPGHPGLKHWSCCGATEEMSDCLLGSKVDCGDVSGCLV